MNFRISEEADLLIRRKAAQAQMSITDYVICAAAGKKVINYEGLNEVVSQIKRLGNNVNQLVILARQERIQVVNLAPVLEELSMIHEELADVLRQGR